MAGRIDPQWIQLARAAAEDLGGLNCESLATVLAEGNPLSRLLDADPDIESAGRLYEYLLHEVETRKESGSYFTPPLLVQSLLDQTFEPLAQERPLDSLRICDPACGTGHFLLAAASRLAMKRAALENVPPSSIAAKVVAHSIFGVDRDPLAVDLCRRALRRFAGTDVDLSRNIRCADSLSGAPAGSPAEADRWCAKFAPGGSSFFHWHHEFPEGFDLVLGNPPFINVIEQKCPDPYLKLRRAAFPELGGTADRSFYFLALALRILKPGGRIGMVLPRNILNAPAAQRLRARLHPRYLEIPDQSNLFERAAVFVCLLGLGPAGPCLVANAGSLREVEIESDNWWHCLQGTSRHTQGETVGRRFEVRTSMTAADAYDCLPWLADCEEGSWPKLLTTGLIDPGRALWGLTNCRYLGRRLRFPRISTDVGTKSLRERLERAHRPKIVVAGLSKRIECLLDPQGEFLGAVSTYSIFHPQDDLEALARLQELLSRDEVSRLFRDVLGANALGGGSITLRRSFLESIPCEDLL